MNYINNLTDEENLRWSWLRAIEWGVFPIFISQPVVPILLLYFKWWYIILIIVISTWFWALVRYQFVSISLANIGSLFVYLKWISSIGVGIYFFMNREYFLAIFSCLYPIIVLFLQMFTPTTKIGVLQNMFMNRLGYYKA